jgi:GTA TIM-barrel-like domain/Putative phage tail protein
MATLVLAAAGSAVGGTFGGSMLGLTGLAVGKAVGATLGSVIDQRLMGLGAAPVESGRVDRFRVMGSSEGAPLPRVFGRMRVAGQMIWSSRFLESVESERVGGKGGGATVKEFSYSVSLAVALCEGEVTRVGRIWADGQPLAQSGLTWRLHRGTEDQLPDPTVAAIEGADLAPAYRGTAYVVFENLDLTSYGNRIPQFSFEVFRRPVPKPGLPRSPALDVRGIALVPGTGEYALASEPVVFKRGKGETTSINVHNDLGVQDLVASLAQLEAELPRVESVSLVVSWFGDDLRCDRCQLYPAVEQTVEDGEPMRWKVSGIGRSGARVVSRKDDRPIFGGTPADAAVLQSIAHIKAMGRAVMFYPFILMDIQDGNGLADPWSDAANQPAVPWRGRITLSEAPGRPGSPDRTSIAAAEVTAFFGQAQSEHFDADGGTVAYTGPAEWSYRRFVLHYAHLCALAGGVDAFCIGSEMRSLTQVRDGADSYPAVRALCDLAADVRAILGPGVKIGYAADWSEYFGHQPADGSGDVLYHLDPLWAHPAIDFVGIDNYMPLSDWRDGTLHADVSAGSIYDLSYLRGNVAGGEGFDWYYADAAGRDAQVRVPIQDGAYGEDWVFRYKDLVNWWSQPHENRIGGVKTGAATDWQPRSKPIWFTELGCPAVDKGTNQPNVFFDPKSSESLLPYHSNGQRDDFIQHRYLQAMFGHWNDLANNPVSDVYGGHMVDMSRTHVWAWDARPWPDFPNRRETWADGGNFELGHWLNGRIAAVSLADVVSEICARSNLEEVDVSRVHGGVTGYIVGSVESARQSLQPLMLAHAFDSFASERKIVFANRNGRIITDIETGEMVASAREPAFVRVRAPAAETAGRVTLGYVRADLDYQSGAVEARAPDEAEPATSQRELPMVLTTGEARSIAERWLAEARIAEDSVKFDLPLSHLALTAGDVLTFEAGGIGHTYRLDRIDEMGRRQVRAVRIEAEIYDRPAVRDVPMPGRSILAPTAVHAEFLDLPLLTGDEAPHAPHIAVTKRPWAGAVAVYSATNDFGYRLNREVLRPAVMGALIDPLPRAMPGRWTTAGVRVRVVSGTLQSKSEADVLNGANAAAIRFGGSGDWEVLQFCEADLIAPREYRLAKLLRGQAGTDGVVPDLWPAGTDFVLIDSAVRQLSLSASARGLERNYRIGAAARPYADPSYEHYVEAFAGVGLRPYKPAHLAASRRGDGDILVSWTRRTRIDGDSWGGTDVPLGEERELYHLRIMKDGAVLREFYPASPNQLYGAAEQAVDNATGPLTVEVAQVSDRFGPGPYERISFDG